MMAICSCEDLGWCKYGAIMASCGIASWQEAGTGGGRAERKGEKEMGGGKGQEEGGRRRGGGSERRVKEGGSEDGVTEGLKEMHDNFF